MMANEATAENKAPSFIVKGQYVKDLSFENPNAPHSLLIAGNSPKIEVSVDLKAGKIQEDVYEMILHITAKSTTSDGKALFLVDLAYAGIFEISNVPEDRIEPLIMIDCPFVLFPFARRVISDVTRDGGFPPLMLDPIDFHSLYVQNKQNVA